MGRSYVLTVDLQDHVVHQPSHSSSRTTHQARQEQPARGRFANKPSAGGALSPTQEEDESILSPAGSRSPARGHQQHSSHGGLRKEPKQWLSGLVGRGGSSRQFVHNKPPSRSPPAGRLIAPAGTPASHFESTPGSSVPHFSQSMPGSWGSSPQGPAHDPRRPLWGGTDAANQVPPYPQQYQIVRDHTGREIRMPIEQSSGASSQAHLYKLDPTHRTRPHQPAASSQAAQHRMHAHQQPTVLTFGSMEAPHFVPPKSADATEKSRTIVVSDETMNGYGNAASPPKSAANISSPPRGGAAGGARGPAFGDPTRTTAPAWTAPGGPRPAGFLPPPVQGGGPRRPSTDHHAGARQEYGSSLEQENSYDHFGDHALFPPSPAQEQFQPEYPGIPTESSAEFQPERLLVGGGVAGPSSGGAAGADAGSNIRLPPPGHMVSGEPRPAGVEHRPSVDGLGAGRPTGVGGPLVDPEWLNDDPRHVMSPVYTPNIGAPYRGGRSDMW